MKYVYGIKYSNFTTGESYSMAAVYDSFDKAVQAASRQCKMAEVSMGGREYERECKSLEDLNLQSNALFRARLFNPTTGETYQHYVVMKIDLL